MPAAGKFIDSTRESCLWGLGTRDSCPGEKVKKRRRGGVGGSLDQLSGSRVVKNDITEVDRMSEKTASTENLKCKPHRRKPVGSTCSTGTLLCGLARTVASQTKTEEVAGCVGSRTNEKGRRGL